MGFLWSKPKRTGSTAVDEKEEAATTNIAASAPQNVKDTTLPLRFFKERDGCSVHVVLVRHGERIDHTAHGESWSAAASTKERADPPLSSRGLEQATELGTWWRKKAHGHKGTTPKYEVTCIVTSPFARCRQTAAVLSKHIQAPVVVCDWASEWLSRQLFPTGAPDHVLADSGDATRVRLEDAPCYPETKPSMTKRVAEGLTHFLDRLRSVPCTSSQHADQMRFSVSGLSKSSGGPPRGDNIRSVRVVVVTHADVISSLLAALTPRCPGSDAGLPSVPYASLTLLEKRDDGDWQLVTRGDTTPLSRTKVLVQLQR